LASASARAGHEIPFYPSFYPQEITVTLVAPAAAPRQLERNALHAYIGPLGSVKPAHTAWIESLRSFVLVRFNPASPAWADSARRCAAAARLLAALEPSRGDYTFQPYPVTPYHEDFLHHGDLVEAAKRKAREAPRGGVALRIRATGRLARTAERLNLERRLVSLLARGCERVPVGYRVKREAINDDYSEGVENIGWDAQAGLGSAVFLRTVKLKDFPWNGWLRLGLASRPAAAWNPIAGFGDDAGRLVWAALGDPALLPAPYGGGWIPNRVRALPPSGDAPSGVEVPHDALVPDPATGVLRAPASALTARQKVTYRVMLSKFHDD